jgi:hypothetical protein
MRATEKAGGKIRWSFPDRTKSVDSRPTLATFAGIRGKFCSENAKESVDPPSRDWTNPSNVGAHKGG